MRYKKQGQSRRYRLQVPSLSGGLNTAVPPTLIEDNELTAVCNLRLRNGALQTRKAVRYTDREPLVYISEDETHPRFATFDSVLPHPFEIDGQLCTVVITAANYGSVGGVHGNAFQHVQVVTLDGEKLKEYTVDGWHVRDMVVAPCDTETYGCPFLLYGGNAVYKPND
ncbi:MAG: hypothetical protein IKV35_06380, partial [Clostridia bacterium]|nr:hypothetical protein [Clostridia bacterium]